MALRRAAREVILYHMTSKTFHQNNEERKGFRMLEQYVSHTYHTVAPSFGAYVRRERPKKRQIVIFVLKLAQILFIVRFGLNVLFGDNHFLRVVLLADASHLFGQRILISFVVCIGHLVSLLQSLVILYMEYHNKLTVVKYLNQIKNKQAKILLDEVNAKKYYTRMNFIGQYLSWPLLANLCVNSFMIFCLPTYIAYFKQPELGYTKWTVILWTPINILAIFDFNSQILGKTFPRPWGKSFPNNYE